MRNDYKSGLWPQVGKTGFINKLFNFFSRKSRRLGSGTRITKKQDNNFLANGAPLMALFGIVGKSEGIKYK